MNISEVILPGWQSAITTMPHTRILLSRGFPAMLLLYITLVVLQAQQTTCLPTPSPLTSAQHVDILPLGVRTSPEIQRTTVLPSLDMTTTTATERIKRAIHNLSLVMIRTFDHPTMPPNSPTSPNPSSLSAKSVMERRKYPKKNLSKRIEATPALISNVGLAVVITVGVLIGLAVGTITCCGHDWRYHRLRSSRHKIEHAASNAP